ncbi:MAG: hypothetical protein ACK4N1_10655 [Pseudorhizobium sp.]
MIENLILFLTPIIGVSGVAALVLWQNERETASRELRNKKK